MWSWPLALPWPWPHAESSRVRLVVRMRRPLHAAASELAFTLVDVRSKYLCLHGCSFSMGMFGTTFPCLIQPHGGFAEFQAVLRGGAGRAPPISCACVCGWVVHGSFRSSKRFLPISANISHNHNYLRHKQIEQLRFIPLFPSHC